MDLTGKQFGRLVVIRQVDSKLSPSGQIKRRWKCKCNCGNVVVVQQSNLRGGHTRSCGCLRREVVSLRRHIHGLAGTPIYCRWRQMLQRCQNPHTVGYQNYGGRGIVVCKRWLSFECFYSDMGKPPFIGATLERVDNAGDYCPENVKWASRVQQNRNARSNVVVIANGQSRTVAEWSECNGIPVHTIYRRLKRGWSDTRTVLSPVQTKYRNGLCTKGTNYAENI